MCAGFAVPVQLAAQTYTAAHVQFSSLGTFSQQQLEDTVQVHAGTKLTATELGAAAQRLVDTGYFDDVSATIEGTLSAATIKFEDKPTPTAHMLHVGFENFVWLTHDEIEAAIHGRIPLFNDYLPENSAHQDEIQAALTAALAARSVNAKVVYETHEPTLLYPVREIGFRVLSPGVVVSNIKLAGVTPALVPLVQKSVNATAHTGYTEGPADITTASRILAPLLDAGYVRSVLANGAVSAPALVNGSYEVVYSATLQPGDLYHVSELTFAGSKLVSAEEFAAKAKLHAGDVASHALLLESLGTIDSAYRRKGYMDVVVLATPAFDEASHQVAYTVSVDPGEPYRIHEVTPEHLDPAALADFNRGFLMKAGEVYNPEYVTGFLKANTALLALAGYNATFKAYADPNTHLVDLYINFYKAGR